MVIFTSQGVFLLIYNEYLMRKEAIVMKEIIFILEEDIEGGYTARALEFPIFTQGETLEEVKRNIKDALRCHFDEEDKIPKVIRLHTVKEEVFSYA
jgi:predicted RNase H-like HicB family nuclease